MDGALDFLSSLLDEVALEGLDGITLPMLWARLENRPLFPIALDDDSKIFLWECIAVHPEVDIFKLPAPRTFVPIYNRYDDIDIEIGVVKESAEVNDPYPIVPVDDDSVRGSCATYHQRVNITSEIRYDNVLLVPLKEAMEKWGEGLVLVASPKTRLLALIGTGTNPLIEFNRDEYLLLERIGRSRYLGEVTQGEGGLLKTKAPFVKQIFYYRKKLTHKGLITKQVHYMQSLKNMLCTGSIFHLTRFYVERKSKVQLWLKNICDMLSERPDNRELHANIVSELAISGRLFNKLLKRSFVQRFIKVVFITYSDFSSNSAEELGLENPNRTVKCIQLIKHIDEVEQDEMMLEGKSINSEGSCFDGSKVCHELPLISQTYIHIKAAGHHGVCAKTLGNLLTLPRLEIRSLLRVLMKMDYIVGILKDKGRQKTTMYFAKEYVKSLAEYSTFQDKLTNRQAEATTETVVEQGDISMVNENCDENSTTTEIRIQENPEMMEVENIPTPEPKKRANENEDLPVLKKLKLDNNNAADIEDDSFSGIDFQKINIEIVEAAYTKTNTGHVSVARQLNLKPVSKPKVTLRFLKRASLILDHTESVMVSTVADLWKLLKDKEKEEGYSFTCDKKSTARIINQLSEEKKLRILNVTMELKGEVEVVEFICDPSLELTDSRFHAAVEQAKIRCFGFNKKGKEKEAKQENDKENSPKLPSKFYQHPKCVRAKMLHTFLFYIAWKYEGKAMEPCKEPIVYYDSMDWKRFIPPTSNQYGPGWCYFTDFLARMPLSIFLKVINFKENIPKLKEYMNDEEKENYLVTHLPKDLRNQLLPNRNYLFALDEVLKYLCYMGLISYGPRNGKMKDQVYVYVHRSSKFKDTRTTTPEYLHINKNLSYKEQTYVFNSLDDLDDYWLDLENICVRTPLGKYTAVVGTIVEIESLTSKPEMNKCLKNKSFESITEAVDVPGDGLGAGGFDSALYMHLKRKWSKSNLITSKHGGKPNDTETSKMCPTDSMQYILQTKISLQNTNRKRLRRHTNNLASLLKFAKVEKMAKEPKRKGKWPIRRLVKRGNHLKKKRQPYYDDKDKAAIKKMLKFRCDWTAQEDSFLLLCKVASLFLDPSYARLVVPFTFVRDLLHERLPNISASKSSRACQRRLRYMMLNPTTASNVSVFLAEAKQDQNLSGAFQMEKPPLTKENEWKVMFKSLMDMLLIKFTLPASDRCESMILPSSLEELNACYEIVPLTSVLQEEKFHKEPERPSDIDYVTVYGLVLSSLATHDGGIWSQMLLKLYNKVPKCILEAVYKNLQEHRIIAKMRHLNKKDREHSITNNLRFRYSVTYDNALLTKFPIKLYSESRELIKILHEAPNCSNIELKGDIPPGYITVLLALSQMNQLTFNIKIPDQIILFDSSLSKEAKDTIVERMIHTLNDKESDELTRLLNNGDNVIMESGDGDSKTKLKGMHNSENMTEMVSKSNTETQNFSNASRYALYLLRHELSQPPIERVQHSQDYIVLNSCRVFCQLKRTAHNFSIPISPKRVLKEIHEWEKIVNSSYITKSTMILTEKKIVEIKNRLVSYLPRNLFQKHQSTSFEMLYENYSPQTLYDGECIWNYILNSGQIGVLQKELWQTFISLPGELNLFQHLNMMREVLFVIRVGSVEFRYVATKHSKRWVLSSYLLPSGKVGNESGTSVKRQPEIETLNDEQDVENSSEMPVIKSELDDYDDIVVNDSTTPQAGETECNSRSSRCDGDVKFLIRTWRKPDGSLNKPAFFQLLSTILGYIITQPGVTESQICKRFALALQPVQTLELIEVLENASCVCKYYSKPMQRGTLFSALTDVYITENPGPDDIVHYEPLPDAICKIDKLQQMF